MDKNGKIVIICVSLLAAIIISGCATGMAAPPINEAVYTTKAKGKGKNTTTESFALASAELVVTEPEVMTMVEAVIEPEPIVEPIIVEPRKIAKIRVLEMNTTEPVTKRLAVYNAEMWDYPYKDWTVTQIPEGEAWEGWYATTSTGTAIIEWEISREFHYGGVEQSTDLKNWYRTFCIDHYYIRYDETSGTWKRKISVPLVADETTGKVGRNFFRLNLVFVNELPENTIQ